MSRSRLGGNGERRGWQRKNVQSQRDMEDCIWEVVNYCVWRECEVRASQAVLLKKDRRSRWRGERQGQTEHDGILQNINLTLGEIIGFRMTFLLSAR